MPPPKAKWNPRLSAAVSARRVLPGLVADYFEEVRHFLAKHREPKELHRMRLAAKSLRYTLELFRPCYGPGLEQRLGALKQLQNLLGDLNDATSTRKLLGKSVDRKVRTFLRERAEKKADKFRDHWKETFDADGQEKWWTEYLKQHARSPRKG